MYLIQSLHMDKLSPTLPSASWIVDKVPGDPISSTKVGAILYIDNFAVIAPEDANPQASVDGMIETLESHGIAAERDPFDSEFNERISASIANISNKDKCIDIFKDI